MRRQKEYEAEVKERWPKLNRSERKKVAMLMQRKEFLEDKVGDSGVDAFHWWKAETNALDWVLTEVIPDFHESIHEGRDPDIRALPAHAVQEDIDDVAAVPV